MAYAALIVWLSLTSQPPQPFHLWDKAQHFLAYMVLAAWFGAVCHRSIFFLIVAAAAVMGIGLEVIQGGSGVRQFDAGDMVANGLGALSGVLAALTPLGNAFIRFERLWHE
ncbi:MAG: VanZ family protein [Hydrocarboniphaga effusa]|nr:VanZ family protein [Hydrocarboniphaga effusa]